MSAHPAIAGLILAAGESTRMGRDKALLRYGGRTFLETIIATLHEAGIERVVVVLGHHARQIQQGAVLEGVEVVINQNYRLGQTSSLQAGLRAFAESEIEGILLCLVDHPAVLAGTLQKLVQTFRTAGKPVVLPTLNGERGHPVLMSSELFRELEVLGPQEQANTVVRKYRDRTQFVEVNDPGILLDIDDAKTYSRLR